jgi:hypothetical protein
MMMMHWAGRVPVSAVRPPSAVGRQSSPAPDEIGSDRTGPGS